jgi:anti-anti-sigma factor
VVQPLLELLLVDGTPTVRGECDLSRSADIETWLASFSGAPVDVDLSGVTFIDSSGLKAFLNARRTNPGLRIVAPSATVTRLLELTATGEYLLGENGNPRLSD